MTLPTKLGLHLSHLRLFIIRIEHCICNTTALVLSKEFYMYTAIYTQGQLITFIQHTAIHQGTLLKASWVICLCMSFPPNKYAMKMLTHLTLSHLRHILQCCLTTNKLVRHILNHTRCCEDNWQEYLFKQAEKSTILVTIIVKRGKTKTT